MRRSIVLGAASAALFLPFAAANGCSSNSSSGVGFGGQLGASTTATGGAGGAKAAGGGGATATGGAGGNMFIVPEGGPDAPNDAMKNPCGTACGPTELCDPQHLGLDDNCDGRVDEGCPCISGQAHSCFKGDASYLKSSPDTCFPGTETCTELGFWGPCEGGVHAVAPDFCYNNNVTNCHPIQSPPFAPVDLKTGTGAFSNMADPGSESYMVTCPTGVTQCPMVTPPSSYTPLQSGEYDVLYTKSVGGVVSTCTFPLFVDAPGLRVELTWEHPLGSSGVDLDLHMHAPMTTTPWGISGKPNDCGYANCKAEDIVGGGIGTTPHWFPNTNMVPDPVNWYLDPVKAKNTCYFDPGGAGKTWQQSGLGCHNPRLDVDDITCDPTNMNPNSGNFCSPENINIDFPPLKQWIRVGVYYYGSHDETYSVHPTIKIFCAGQLAAELGDHGYYSPEAPVTFTAVDGATAGGNTFWEVADVAFLDDQCSITPCVVQPIFSDAPNKTPYLVPSTIATTSFQPPYPVLPP